MSETKITEEVLRELESLPFGEDGPVRDLIKEIRHLRAKHERLTEPLFEQEMTTIQDGAAVTGSAPQWQVSKLCAEILRQRVAIERLESSIEDRAREMAQEMVDSMYPPKLVR